MEIQFIETLQIKINAINNSKKTAMAEIDSKKPGAHFIPAGSLTSKNVKAKKEGADPETKRKRYEQLMRKVESKEVKDYIEEMKEINKRLDLDNKYVEKFGLFKKATVLLYNERDYEAKQYLAKAATIAAE